MLRGCQPCGPFPQGRNASVQHYWSFNINQTSDAGPGRGTLVMAGERRILAVQRQRSDRIFHDVGTQILFLSFRSPLPRATYFGAPAERRGRSGVLQVFCIAHVSLN